MHLQRSRATTKIICKVIKIGLLVLFRLGVSMKVRWHNGHLQVVAGDEIKVLRGRGKRESGQILATQIKNITRGTHFKSSVEGVLRMEMPHDFIPPIHGYAKNIEIDGGVVSFILEEKAPPIVSGIIRECAKFIDPKLYERCKDKDYHDVVTNAFPILEDRIRAKIGVDPSYSGRKLIDHAFNPNTGKLTFGETKSEREAFYFLFQGALGFLRNPPSHRLTEDQGNIEPFEIICMVDLLLRIVDKAKLRQLPRKIPAQARSMKPTLKLPGAGIELTRIRQEHSIKIKDEALKPWLAKVGEYCKIEAVYSKDADRMVGIEPNDPSDLNFFDVAKSHLESKYPDILEAWEDLKRITSELNKELAIILEEIRTLTIKELELPCYYWFLGVEEPEEHIKPDKIAQSIYQEIEWRAPQKRKWMIGKPHVHPVIYGREQFYELEWRERLMKSRDEEKVKRAILLIDKIVETPKFKEMTEKLTKRKDEIYKTHRETFEAKIKEVIKSIELGNVLKGKCKYCP